MAKSKHDIYAICLGYIQQILSSRKVYPKNDNIEHTKRFSELL